MPFLIQRKNNWKIIAIAAILSIIVGGGILSHLDYFKKGIPFSTKFPERRRQENSIKDKTADWKTYRNNEYGFEIKYPEGWQVKRKKIDKIYPEFLNQQMEPLNKIEFFSPKEPQENVTITIYNNSKNYPLDEWLDVYREISPTGYSLALKEKLLVNGKEVLKGGFGCCMSYQQSAFLREGDKVYQITGGMMEWETNTYKYEEIFNQMLSTFKIYSEKMLPSFEDFPVSEQFKGMPVSPDFSSNPDALRFVTKITEGVKEGPNFAGHCTIIEWKCGTECLSGVVVDAKTGKIYNLPPAYFRRGFRIDSNLLIIDPPETVEEYYSSRNWLFSKYYEWKNNQFILIYKYRPKLIERSHF